MKNSREKNNSEWEMAFNNNTESFQLPIQNNLNIARFSVEKIVDTVLANVSIFTLNFEHLSPKQKKGLYMLYIFFFLIFYIL